MANNVEIGDWVSVKKFLYNYSKSFPGLKIGETGIVTKEIETSHRKGYKRFEIDTQKPEIGRNGKVRLYSPEFTVIGHRYDDCEDIRIPNIHSDIATICKHNVGLDNGYGLYDSKHIGVFDNDQEKDCDMELECNECKWTPALDSNATVDSTKSEIQELKNMIEKENVNMENYVKKLESVVDCFRQKYAETIRKSFRDKIESLKEKDPVVKILKRYQESLDKELRDNGFVEENEIVVADIRTKLKSDEYDCDLRALCYSKEFYEKRKEIVEEKDRWINRLDTFCRECGTVVSMCDSFESGVEVLTDYGILELERVVLNGSFKWEKVLKNFGE